MITRRRFLTQTTLAAGSLLGIEALAQEMNPPVIVETPLGKLSGESQGGVKVFRGVPFARPPVGDLRFRAPQAAQPWRGVRDASPFAPAAFQPGGQEHGCSEDCLYLNIWSPQKPGKYPVFVWIHGGGFTGGSSSDPMSNGTGFAQSGIVVVTIAYRLGVFGFLDVEPMLGASYAGSANNGLRDIVAALLWVQGNIASFGGDPGRVTIGGESAGAKLTDILMGVPAAQPLFHQMISESGGAERLWSRDRAFEVSKGFANTWTEHAGSQPSNIATVGPEELIRMQEQFIRDWPVHFPFRPEIDGKLVPRLPIETIRRGSSKGKRLLIGTNRDESAFFIGPSPAKDPVAANLGNISLTQFESIADGYAKLYPDMSAPLRRIRSVTAEEYWIPSMRVAEAHISGGNEAFVYRLDFGGEGRFANLAYHSFDLRFVWDHLNGKSTDEDRRLAASMHSAWTSFIEGRAPSGPGLPSWPLFTQAKQPTMIFDTRNRVEDYPDKAELALWDGVLGDHPRP